MKTKDNAVKKRQSNFELLRIVSMLLIVCQHYAVHGGFDYNHMEYSANKVFLQFLSYGGKLGVNLFVLISGYFLAASGFSGKRAVRFFADVTVYSVLILVSAAIGGAKIGVKSVIEGILPIPYGTWWFASTYFVLYILTGYINRFLALASRARLDGLIAILVTVCSVIPTFTMTRMATSDLSWFVTLYLIAARLRLYPPGKKIFKYSLAIGLFGYALCLGSCFLFDVLGTRGSVMGHYATYFAGVDTVTMLFCSVFIFLGFQNMDLGSSRVINTVAATTFGVYLIHENPFGRSYLWWQLFKNVEYAHSSRLPVHACAAILLTFAGCSLISLVYNMTIGRLIAAWLDRHYEPVKKHLAGLFAKAGEALDRLIP